MEIHFSLLAIQILLGTIYSSEARSESCNGPPVTGCNVSEGLAVCRSTSLPAVVQALPGCVNRLHFMISHYVDLNDTDFFHLENLKELVIEGQFLKYVSFRGLPALQILKIRDSSYGPLGENILKDTKQLKLFDITR